MRMFAFHKTNINGQKIKKKEMESYMSINKNINLKVLLNVQNEINVVKKCV